MTRQPHKHQHSVPAPEQKRDDETELTDAQIEMASVRATLLHVIRVAAQAERAVAQPKSAIWPNSTKHDIGVLARRTMADLTARMDSYVDALESCFAEAEALIARAALAELSERELEGLRLSKSLACRLSELSSADDTDAEREKIADFVIESLRELCVIDLFDVGKIREVVLNPIRLANDGEKKQSLLNRHFVTVHGGAQQAADQLLARIQYKSKTPIRDDRALQRSMDGGLVDERSLELAEALEQLMPDKLASIRYVLEIMDIPKPVIDSVLRALAETEITTTVTP